MTIGNDLKMEFWELKIDIWRSGFWSQKENGELEFSEIRPPPYQASKMITFHRFKNENERDKSWNLTLIKGREMGAIVAYEKLKIGVLGLKLASLEKFWFISPTWIEVSKKKWLKGGRKMD